MAKSQPTITGALAGGGVALILLSASCGISEKFTAGTLTVTMMDAENEVSAVGVEVVLFELVDPAQEVSDDDQGYRYRTDSQGTFRHAWGWLGGGGEYSVTIRVADPRYAALDATSVFPVRGTKEDNDLTWSLPLERQSP